MAKDDKAAEEKATQGVQVRILLDHGAFKCNTVETLDAKAAAALVKAGVADDDPAAVAACLEWQPAKK